MSGTLRPVYIPDARNYLKMAFQPDLSDLGREGSPNRVGHLLAGVGKTVRAPEGSASRILIRDTWNTDILAAVESPFRAIPHRVLQPPLQLSHWQSRRCARSSSGFQ